MTQHSLIPSRSATASEPMPRRTRSARGHRWVPLSGIAFAVFFVAGVVASNPPADSASDQAWLNAYAGSHHTMEHVATAYCLVLSALSLAVFFSTVWSRIRDARPNEEMTVVPLVAAGVAAACISVGGVLMGVVSITALRGYVQLLRFGNDGGFAMVAVGGMISAAVAVFVLSITGRRAGVFGRAISWFGLITALAQLAALTFFPVLLMLVWAIAAAISLLRHQPTPPVLDQEQ